ncbi:polyprenyl synthetase family protein [Enterococcus sp. LJL98]
MLTYWNDYPMIQNKLQTVCSLIEERFQIDNKEIQGALLHLAQAGGKFLRPTFFFLFADLGNKNEQDLQQLTKIAASLEILHMASLIHDDIIDDSPLRRNTTTIQAQYGKDVAVYTGDLLFTIFFDLLIETMNGTPYLAKNSQAMKNLLLGELNQMASRFQIESTVENYLENINGKTAELFALSCAEGAYFGRCSETMVQQAEQIGRNIGMAFQIFDDILDYTAKKKDLKKPILEDLAQGVYTLPLLLAKQNQPVAFAPYLEKKAAITNEEAQEVAKLVVTHQGVKEAKAYAKAFTNQALAGIETLPKGETKKMLKKLTTHLLLRTF